MTDSTITFDRLTATFDRIYKPTISYITVNPDDFVAMAKLTKMQVGVGLFSIPVIGDAHVAVGNAEVLMSDGTVKVYSL